MSKDGIIALIASIAIIAGAVYWFTNFGPKAAAVDAQNETPSIGYATEDEFPAIESASGEEVERALIEAFNAGRLLEVLSIDIPETEGDQLVLATPTKSGTEEAVNCDVRGHRYCGLYRKSSQGNQLVLWGSRLAGFAGVERFTDSEHVIIGSAWNMLNFTSIERYELNLQNGELVPKLLMELDVGEDFGELQVSGYGEALSLWIEGYYHTGNVIPERVVVRNAEDHDEIYSELDREDVLRIAELVEQSEEIVDPIFVLPSDDDVETLTVHLELYGEPYVLDLNEHTLLPEEQTEDDQS